MSHTVRSILETTRQRLASAGVEPVSSEVEWILGDILHVSRSDLYASPDRILDPAEAARLEEVVSRRERREPLQYILGKTEFFSLEFEITPDVLVPRPETETVVERALDCLPSHRHARILDVGTGSGAIAVSLAVHRPETSVHGVDISTRALATARRNAVLHSTRLRGFCAHFAFLPTPSGVFDLVVSNPPYVADADLAGLEPEVRCFEPRLALAAGQEGLDAYTALVPEAHRVLKPGGCLVLELPGTRADRVEAIAHTHFRSTQRFDDLTGKPRVLLGRKLA